MEIQPKKGIRLSSPEFFGLILLAALGWMIGVFLFGRVNTSELSKLLSDLGMEMIKALIIGTAGAIVVDRYLKRFMEDSSEAMLKAPGIKRIYASRAEAASDLLALVQKTKHVQLVGISLRDFLRPAGILEQIWIAVCNRLDQEHRDNSPPDERLHVKILLLDPRSGEGHFRRAVEEPASRVLGLETDVPQALAAVATQQAKLGGPSNKFLQARLYEHSPFSLVISTDTEVFVEQYDYRNQSLPAALPLIAYYSGTPQYREFQFSLKHIWDRADKRPYKQHEIGTASAINASRLKNIYRKEHRSLLTERQIEAIKATRERATVDIVAITGKFYNNESIRRFSSGPEPRTVRLAVVNPVSEQAILRAVADSEATADSVRTALQQWTWDRHRETSLYLDVHRTIGYFRTWAQRGCQMELHLYSSSIACALLLSQDGFFVEQYIYGRSNEAAQGRVLGGEYPVVEYSAGHEKDKEDDGPIEPEILTSTFNIIWNCFSITDEEFAQRNQEDEFNRNLDRLLMELGYRQNSIGTAA